MTLAKKLLTNAKRPVEWEVNRNKNIGICFTKCKRFQILKEISMDKRFWEKSCRYSIRKMTVGTASVLLGAVLLVNHTVAADSVEVKQTEPTSVEAITKPDSETKAVEATETTNPSLAESPVVSESKPAEETQKTNSQASEEAIVEAKENKNLKKQISL